MKRKRRLQAVLKCGLIAAILASSIPSFGTAYAANEAQTPQLNAYQLGNHVKLEWGVDILDTDVLNRTSYENGDEIPNFYGGGMD
ncbi:hypothetical protein ACL02P_01650 [Paenibacillus sp. MB22_1]|jgi:hypothetical protein|uniref:hypothetical protein n=1 Tax=Paenibacillus sp. MB22_1 TaxID=3383121 RepID=UPI0039A080D2